MTKVLVLSDAGKIFNIVGEVLREKKMPFDRVSSVGKAIDWWSTGNYDALIINWSDFQQSVVQTICNELRDSEDTFPILSVIPDSRLMTKVAALQCSDDCLPQPFDSTELYARLAALLRRKPQRIRSVLSRGDLSLDLLSDEATFKTQPLNLSRKEMEILHVLAQHPGKIYTRYELADETSNGRRLPSLGTIRTHITRIRAKLDHIEEGASTLIRTVYGGGYFLSPSTTNGDRQN
ncbi:MAG: response regulator transcription factor [Cyanobacteria bacterium]|nr:response regulator transcription factor [Cyanobacteriota bacterium]